MTGSPDLPTAYLEMRMQDRRVCLYVNGKRYRWWHRLLKRLPA